MDAHEDRVLGADLPLDEGDVGVAVQLVAVGVGGELAADPQRHPGFTGALHQPLAVHPVLDQVLDGDDLQAVFDGERLEIRHARHRAVLVHDLADHPGGDASGEPGEVDRPFRLARPHQHPALPGDEGEDVTRADEVFRSRVFRDGGSDRGGPVVRRDAGAHAAARLDRDGEGGAERRGVVVHHRGELQGLRLLLGDAEADEPSPVAGHEIDRLGGDELRGEGQVALVLAVLVVHEDDHPAVADVRDGILDLRKRHSVPALLTNTRDLSGNPA